MSRPVLSLNYYNPSVNRAVGIAGVRMFSNTIGIRVLAAIADAVPVRLMKRDLLFVTERLAGLVEERRLEIIARQHGIKRENAASA